MIAVGYAGVSSICAAQIVSSLEMIVYLVRLMSISAIVFILLVGHGRSSFSQINYLYSVGQM